MTLDYFHDFYNSIDQTERFNRTHMVLLPKKDSTRTPDAYRPISLQNCPIKVVAKLLTTRLKPLIQLLVHADQTGFIFGINIAKNFVYAANILSACNQRKTPTLVLKLEFRKSFDSVSWTLLLQLLAHQGSHLDGDTSRKRAFCPGS
jgi:hypothetical protein